MGPQDALALAIVIAFGCFCFTFACVFVLHYWKHNVKEGNYPTSSDNTPLYTMTPDWLNNLSYKLRQRFQRKSRNELGKSIKLGFEIPYKYEMYIDDSYSMSKEQHHIKIKCLDLKVQFRGQLTLGPRTDGTWGYTNFSLGGVCHIKYEDNMKPSGEGLFPYGTSLLAVDKRSKEIVDVFDKQRITSARSDFFDNEWKKWMDNIDNFDAMRGHNAKHKK